MSPWPGRSTLITSAPNHASSCVQVGPDWTWVKSRIFTPSSALPSLPHGLEEILGVLAMSLSARFLPDFALSLALPLALSFAFTLSFFAFFLAMVVPYFFLSLLCGLRLPMRPLSLPAAGSIAALMSVGLPESIAALTARFNSSGVVAWTPTPPKASIILS